MLLALGEGKMMKIWELLRPAAIPHSQNAQGHAVYQCSLSAEVSVTKAAIKTWSPQKDPTWTPLKSTFRHSSWILESKAPETELKQTG